MTKEEALSFVYSHETVTEHQCKDRFDGSRCTTTIRTMRSEDVEELINSIYGQGDKGSKKET